jgi:transposase
MVGIVLQGDDRAVGLGIGHDSLGDVTSVEGVDATVRDLSQGPRQLFLHDHCGFVISARRPRRITTR